MSDRSASVSVVTLAPALRMILASPCPQPEHRQRVDPRVDAGQYLPISRRHSGHTGVVELCPLALVCGEKVVEHRPILPGRRSGGRRLVTALHSRRMLPLNLHHTAIAVRDLDKDPSQDVANRSSVSKP